MLPSSYQHIQNTFKWLAAIAILALLATFMAMPALSTAQSGDSLDAPRDLTIVPTSSTTVELTWELVDNATGYQISFTDTVKYDRTIINPGENPSGLHVTVSNNRATISGLTDDGRFYNFAVRATNGETSSPWSKGVSYQATSGTTKDDPPKNTQPEVTIRATTDIGDGAPFTADGYVFELIPHTDFIMAWVANADDTKGARAPAYDINFSCSSDANPLQAHPIGLRYEDDATDGYILRYGPSNSTTSIDLVPATAPPALTDANDFRRRRIETCDPGDTRSDIVAFADYLYTSNITTSIIEAWKLSGRGTQFTREPASDIPMHSATRANFGYGIFNDTAHDDSNTDLIWQVHERAEAGNRQFMPYSISQLRPMPGKTILYVFSDPIIARVSDVYISEDKVYVQPIQSQLIHEYEVTRDSDAFQVGAHTQTIDTSGEVDEEVDDDIQIRTITGYGEVIFAQFHQLTEAVTYNTSEDTFIDSGFNTQPIDGIPHDTNHQKTPGIATDDGRILYIIFPDGIIRFISSIDTTLEDPDLSIDENTPAGTDVRGNLRARSQFPGNIIWTIVKTGTTVHFDECFEQNSVGSKGQIIFFTTKDSTVVDCSHDYEANITGDHGYKFTATAIDSLSSTNQDHQDDLIIRIINVDEPPTGEITIDGIVGAYNVLTANTSTIVDPDGTTTDWMYQWQVKNGSSYDDIAGEALLTFTPQASHEGKRLRVTATYAVDGIPEFGRTLVESADLEPIPVNALPVISIDPTSIPENDNQDPDFTITVTDTNAEDLVTGISLDSTGDYGLFTLTQDPNDVSKAYLNLNTPGDHESTNGYSFYIGITATSGTGQRAHQKTTSFTINITDEAEPPLAPTVLPFSNIKQLSVTAEWTAPDNSGLPPITDYQIQYRLYSTDTWPVGDQTNIFDPTNSAATTETVTGLDRNQNYDFRVRAVNHEGTGPWSDKATQATNANVPPTIDSSHDLDVNENTPAGIRIGAHIAAVDTDHADDGTITFTPSGTDASHFNVDHTPGHLHFWFKTKSHLNYENKHTYSIIVTVDDGQGDSATTTVTITVKDLVEHPSKPETPNLTTPAARTIAISWTEPGLNGGPAITSYDLEYRLKDIDPWEDIPHTDTTTSASIDGLKAATQYQVRVRAHNSELGMSDYSDNAHTQTSDNLRPTFAEDSAGNGIDRTIQETFGNEQESAGRTVGAPITATDPDGGSITHSLRTTGDGSSFDINSTDGQITTKPGYRYDYETKNPYQVTVRATDSHSGEPDQHKDTDVRIEIIDIDEVPAKLDPVTFDVVERFSLLAKWDPKDNTGRPGITSHDIEYTTNIVDLMDPVPTATTAGSSATQKNIQSLVHLTTYYFRVRAVNPEGDGDWSDWANTQTLPDHPPTFGAGNSSRNLAENSSEGDPVGSPVTATDGDSDDIEYSIIGTNTGQFSIVEQSGLIEAGPITYDFENGPNTYTVTVQATDTTVGETATQIVTITITNVHEAPSAPDAPTVTAGDDPRTLDVTWIAPTNTGPAINDYDVQFREGTSGAWTNWMDGVTTTDTETTITGLLAGTSYQVQVRAENPEGDGPYSPSGTGTTTANALPSFTEPITDNLTRTISETIGSANDTGRDIGQAFEATDPDGGTIEFSIIDIPGSNDSAKFSINSSTGQLSTRPGQRYDHEAKPTYTFTVRIKDIHGTESTSYVPAPLKVTIVDQDEAPLKPATPTYSPPTRTQVAIAWSEPDIDGRPLITKYTYEYVKTSQTDTATTVDAMLDTSDTIGDLEHGNTYYFRVKADNHEGPSPWSDWLTVDIPPNRAPTFNSNTDARSIPENTGHNQNVQAPIAASDLDSDTLTYAINTDQPNTGAFTIDPSNGQLKTGSRDYNYEENQTDQTDPTDPTFDVTVRVTDTFNATIEKIVTVTITDVNEPPSTPHVPQTTNQAFTTLSFSWTEPPNTGPPITGYKYQYKAGTGSWSAEIPTTSLTFTATLSNLDENVLHKFQVRAINAEGESPWSTPNETTTKINAQPVIGQGGTANRSIPENTKTVFDLVSAFTVTDANIGTDSGMITWSITTDDTRFQLEVGSGDTPSALLQTKSGQDFNHETTQPFPINIQVTDNQGGSANIEVTITITDVDEQPDRPAAPTEDSHDLDSASIMWIEPGNTGPTITDYDVRYIKVDDDETDDDNWSDWPETATTSTSKTAIIEDLDRGTAYEFQVRAFNDELESVWSPSRTITTTANSVPILTGVDSALSITIDENIAPGSDVGNRFVATDDNPLDDVAFTISDTLPDTHSHLFTVTANGQIKTAPNTVFDFEADLHPYYITLTADDGHPGGQDTVAITINLRNQNEPPAPPVPTFSAIASTSMTVSWTTPDTSDRPDIDQYTTQYGESSTGPWNTTNYDDTITTQTLTSLSPGTVYWFQVRARNAEGLGNYSNPISATAAVNAIPVFDNHATTIIIPLHENTAPNEPVGAAVTADDVETD